MNKLNLLRAKSKEVDCDGQIYNVHGLTYPELTDFAQYIDKKDNHGALNFLLFIVLRKNILTRDVDPVDGMTDAEIKEAMSLVSGKHALTLISTMQEVSGLRDEEAIKKLIANENQVQN